MTRYDRATLYRPVISEQCPGVLLAAQYPPQRTNVSHLTLTQRQQAFSHRGNGKWVTSSDQQKLRNMAEHFFTMHL